MTFAKLLIIFLLLTMKNLTDQLFLSQNILPDKTMPEKKFDHYLNKFCQFCPVKKPEVARNFRLM